MVLGVVGVHVVLGVVGVHVVGVGAGAGGYGAAGT